MGRKKRIERLLYVHDMDMNYSCIGFDASAIAATRLRIFRALASCDGAAENISPLAVPRSHLPSKQLLPPAIRCRASPRLILMPVVRCISSIVLAIAAFCSSVPWMNFRRAAGFCFLSRLVNSRLSRRLSGFVKSSIGGSLSLPVQLLTELRGTALPS